MKLGFTPAISMFILVIIGCLGMVQASEYTDAVVLAADRLIETQNNDGKWEWNWETYDDDKTNGESAPNNTIGSTALGLLRAYQLTDDETYLEGAEKSANYLMANYRATTNFTYQPSDYYFLQEYGDAVGNSSYNDRAEEEWDWMQTNRGIYYGDGNQSTLAHWWMDDPAKGNNVAGWEMSLYILAINPIDPEWAEGAAYVLVDEIADDLPTSGPFSGDLGLTRGLGTKALTELGNSSYDSVIEDFMDGLNNDTNLHNGYTVPQDVSFALMGFAANGDFGSKMTEISNNLIAMQETLGNGGIYDDLNVTSTLLENSEATSQFIDAIYCIINAQEDESDMTIPPFGSNLTDVENYSLISESFGGINFTEALDLTGINVEDIMNYVSISRGRIEIDSSSLPALNKSATLTMDLSGLGYSNPRVLKDGSVCTSCSNVAFLSSILTFDVSGFSVYTVEETPTAPSGGGRSHSHDDDEEDEEDEVVVATFVDETVSASTSTASVVEAESETENANSADYAQITGAATGSSNIEMGLNILVMSLAMVALIVAFVAVKNELSRRRSIYHHARHSAHPHTAH